MEYSARNTIIEKTWFVSLFFYSLASNDGDAGCFRQKCYKIYTSDVAITQRQAIEKCHTLNGSLALIRGMQEQEVLDAYLNSKDDRGFNLYWIGAKREDLNDWRWLDGTMYTDSSNWDISRLNEKTEHKPFAANIAKTKFKIEFHPIPVYDPPSNSAEEKKHFALCLKQGCSQQDSSCYFLRQPAERWTTARNTCLNEVADLATFPEELANDALALLQDEMFYSIGLTRVNWYWAKKQTSVKSDEVKYTNWDLHGPNSHCAALRREESGTTWRWSSYNCNSNSTRGFVCEHGTQATGPPTITDIDIPTQSTTTLTTIPTTTTTSKAAVKDTTTNTVRAVDLQGQITTMGSTTMDNQFIEMNQPDSTKQGGTPHQRSSAVTTSPMGLSMDDKLVISIGAGVVIVVITLVVVIVILCWKRSTRTRPPHPTSFNERSQINAYQATPDVCIVNEPQYAVVSHATKKEKVPTAKADEYANLPAASHDGVSESKKSVRAKNTSPAVEYSAAAAAGDGIVYAAIVRASDAPEPTGNEYELPSHQVVYAELQMPSTGEQ